MLSRKGKTILSVHRKKSVAARRVRRLPKDCRPEVFRLGVDSTGFLKFAVLVAPSCTPRLKKRRRR